MALVEIRNVTKHYHKGGETIKFLRAQTGCMVDIKHQKTPAAVVVVSGTPANVEMCKAYVYRAMDNGDLRALKSFVPPTVPAAVPYVVRWTPSSTRITSGAM